MKTNGKKIVKILVVQASLLLSACGGSHSVTKLSNVALSTEEIDMMRGGHVSALRYVVTGDTGSYANYRQELPLVDQEVNPLPEDVATPKDLKGPGYSGQAKLLEKSEDKTHLQISILEDTSTLISEAPRRAEGKMQREVDVVFAKKTGPNQITSFTWSTFKESFTGEFTAKISIGESGERQEKKVVVSGQLALENPPEDVSALQKESVKIKIKEASIRMNAAATMTEKSQVMADLSQDEEINKVFEYIQASGSIEVDGKSVDLAKAIKLYYLAFIVAFSNYSDPS